MKKENLDRAVEISADLEAINDYINQAQDILYGKSDIETFTFLTGNEFLDKIFVQEAKAFMAKLGCRLLEEKNKLEKEIETL